MKMTLRYTKIPTYGSGAIPAVGFGTLIPDLLATKQATRAALEVGFRHLDCAERYRNEEAVGDAIQEAFKAGTLRREDLFVTTKLWNTNHRPESQAGLRCESPTAAAIAISFILPLPFDPAMSRIRGTNTVG